MCLHTQLFQDAVHAAIELGTFWKVGLSVNAAGQTAEAVSMACYDTYVALATRLGASTTFPKLHDITHIPHDIEWFGSCLGYAAGTTRDSRGSETACCFGYCTCACTHSGYFATCIIICTHAIACVMIALLYVMSMPYVVIV